MFHIDLVTELVKGSILCQHCCSAKLQSCAEQERGGGSVKRDRLIDLCVKGRSSAARTASCVIWLRNERPEYFMVSHQIGTGRQRSPRLIRLIFQYQIERERERERVQFSKPNTLLTAPAEPRDCASGSSVSGSHWPNEPPPRPPFGVGRG